jgi:hypothetical protein
MDKARHFAQRLIALVKEGRLPQPPMLSTSYEVADAKIQDFIQLAGNGRPEEFHGPAVRYPQFVAEQVHHLEAERIPENLVDPAAAALRAILVWESREAGGYATVLYEPFEELLPYRSL